MKMNFAFNGFSVHDISQIYGGVQAAIHSAKNDTSHFILELGLDSTLIDVLYLNGIADTKRCLEYLGVAVGGFFHVFFIQHMQKRGGTFAGRLEFWPVSKSRTRAKVPRGDFVNLEACGLSILGHNVT
jgi:hypothetical protein